MITMRKSRMIIAIAVISTAIGLSGCGKDNPSNEEIVYSDAVLQVSPDPEGNKKFSLAHEFDDITPEMIASLPDVETMTEEEFLDLSLDEFRALISVYVPNYREVYQITSTDELTETEWNSLKALVNYKLFGRLAYQNTTVPTVSGNSVLEEGISEEELTELNELYEASVTDEAFTEADYNELIYLLETVSDEEIIDFMEWIFAESDEDTNYEGIFDDLTTEQISECRQALIEECAQLKSVLITDDISEELTE